MKQKAKLKKRDGKFAKMKLQNRETTMSEHADLSQLRKPVDINLSSLKQATQLFEKGSDEVKALLTYECDLIYECRICRSLFRSLANFISHKRIYCLEKNGMTMRKKEIDLTIREKMFLAPAQLSVNPAKVGNHTIERVLRSQSMQNDPKNDLTSIESARIHEGIEESDSEINVDGKESCSLYHISNDDEQVLLEMIDSKRAAYQTILRPDDTTPNSAELMKSQALELKSMLNRNTAILGPDGQLFEVSDIAESDDQWIEKKDLQTNGNTDIICAICGAQFSTKKTLAFHVKSKHVPHRMCYPCPCCTSTFTNRWSVYRHLFKVHRQTNDQVRRLRAQIQARAFKRNLSRLDKVEKKSASNKSNGTGEEQVTTESQNSSCTQEWRENLELDAELQRCGGCGKRFERKAALVSHVQLCQKRGVIDELREATVSRKRARKMPPKRISGFHETETKVVPTNTAGNPTSTNSEKPTISIIATNEQNIPEKTAVSPKSQSSQVNHNSEELRENQSMESLSINEKSELVSIIDVGAADFSPNEKIEESSAETNLPMEISIRVEDVSSLSKDVWDKMGTSESGDESKSLSPDFSSSMVSSSREQSPHDDSTDTKKKTSSPRVPTDVPEVIYTSISNSRPVTLSVLGSQQKLGIQYRGIRLPTVTLEKINIPRSHVNIMNLEPNVSLKVSKDECLPIKESQQRPNLCKFQCFPCNRKFVSSANLRRHIALHMRRDRYRCKLCDDFKSLLKCDVVAHCNTIHNAKNNRALLAELVVQVPYNSDFDKIEKTTIDNAMEKREELEVLSVSESTENQEIAVETMSDTATSKISDSEETLFSVDQPNATDTTSVPYVRPRRGRPPNSGRRGRKKKTFMPKKRILRHVSPPRLTDKFANEINDIPISIDHSSEPKSKEFSRIRAPSRLDRDPELRKMVMEVIFGSSEKETNDNSPEPDNDESNCVNDNFNDEVLGHRENLEPSGSERMINDEPKVQAANDKCVDATNGGNNNALIQDYRNYEIRTIAINRDDVVFPNSSSYMECQIPTDIPLVRPQNAVLSLSVSPKEK